MIELYGKRVCNGIAIGKIKFYKKEEKKIIRTRVSDVDAEMNRFRQAREEAIDQLNGLYEKALSEVGEEGAELFTVHAMMLEDDDYNDSIENIISKQGLNAEYAVAQTSDNFAEMFENMDDEYFRARAADIRDISERLLRVLTGTEENNDLGEDPVILLADDLTPSETVQMDKSKLLSFVTRLGSSNSHTAILARTMGVPALINIEIKEGWDGLMGIVDGYQQKFIVAPDNITLLKYQKQKEEEKTKKALLLELKGKENVTKSGQKINLYANIGSPEDLALVISNDAGGIGLFRSEFLYLNSDHYPTEDEQFAAYKKVLETMGSKKVIIRTLDIGADKQVDYFKLDKEENPALGYRAIRICLTRPEVFRTQLRALHRASAYGNLAIMYPMIISVDEVKKIKEISRSVREELTAEGLPLGEVEEGIMIETPAACIMADELAKEVDFFSVGTNDLTQYTLAIDRQNSKLDSFYDSHHPAVLRSLKHIVDCAHKEGKWAGVCGELGADTTLTRFFLDIGMDELSMSPASILSVRKIVRETE